MSNLILFTNRSGSTVLTDLLAFSQDSINLGEGLHSLVRGYNYNTQENKQTQLVRSFSWSLTYRFHNQKTKGCDHIGFFKAKNKRIELLKQSDLNWTVKEQLEKQTISMDFVKHCIDSGVNVYLTHRRNVKEQFISKINARYRLEIAKLKTSNNDSQFIYTNNDLYEKYDTMSIPLHWLYLYLNIFINQLFLWRYVYNSFKEDISIVSYEDNIKPMQLEKFGITKQHVELYKSQKVHLVPTPHNASEVIVTPEIEADTAGFWEQCLYYVDRHQYLVDI